MRYALTYATDLEYYGWSSTDTIIVDVDICKEESGWRWFDDETRVADILAAYGLEEKDVKYVIDTNRYYVRNCDDVDFHLDREGKIV